VGWPQFWREGKNTSETGKNVSQVSQKKVGEDFLAFPGQEEAGLHTSKENPGKNALGIKERGETGQDSLRLRKRTLGEYGGKKLIMRSNRKGESGEIENEGFI